MTSLKQVIVNQSPVKGIDQDTITIREVLQAASLDPNVYDVFLLENEGDTGTKVTLDYMLDLRKDPDGKPIRLRAVPSDRSPG